MVRCGVSYYLGNSGWYRIVSSSIRSILLKPCIYTDEIRIRVSWWDGNKSFQTPRSISELFPVWFSLSGSPCDGMLQCWSTWLNCLKTTLWQWRINACRVLQNYRRKLIPPNLSFCLNLHYVQIGTVICSMHRCLHNFPVKAPIQQSNPAHTYTHMHIKYVNIACKIHAE